MHRCSGVEGNHFSDTWMLHLLNPHFSLNKKVKWLEKIEPHVGGEEVLNLDEQQTNIKMEIGLWKMCSVLLNLTSFISFKLHTWCSLFCFQCPAAEVACFFTQQPNDFTPLNKSDVTETFKLSLSFSSSVQSCHLHTRFVSFYSCKCLPDLKNQAVKCS